MECKCQTNYQIEKFSRSFILTIWNVNDVFDDKQNSVKYGFILTIWNVNSVNIK